MKSRKTKVSRKILLLQMIQFISLGILSILSIFILKLQTDNFNSLVDSNNGIMSKLVELKTVFTIYHNNETRYLLYSGDIDTQVKRQYSDDINAIGKKMENILSSFDEKDSDNIFLFIYNIKAYLKLSREFLGSQDINDPEKVKYHITVRSIQKYETANRAIDSLISESFNKYSDLTAENKNTYKKSKYMIIGFNIAVVAVLLVLSFFITVSISRPVKILKNELKKLAETGGDLTQKITVQSNDEIGDMAFELNHFLSMLKEIISDVKNISSVVKNENTRFAESLQNIVMGRECRLENCKIDEGVIQLQEYGGQVLTSITDQTTSVEEIVATLEEIAASGKVMSESAGSTVSVSELVVSEVRQGVSEMNELVGSMKHMEGSIQNANFRIEELVILSNKIKDILVSLNDISAQTNLLALNAAIEAARAGSSGKGFAVVADEVLKLAEQTGMESQQISRLILEINTKIESVKNANKDVTESINAGVAISSSVNRKLTEVFDITDKNYSNVHEMVTSIREQESAFDEITLAITDVNANAEKIQNNETANQEILGNIKSLLLEKLDEIAAVSNKIGELNQKVEKFIT
ncbi:MAG: HAMP domain-containing protein [Spirochaetes bacterium]|nr:HAMP domain-containing protein [Spirochaetota bacterium]